MKIMEFNSMHMYSHILVGAGQSVLYQCAQCVYVCASVHNHVIVSMQSCECV